MGLKNPQANFEDAIFGPKGIHPTPKALPYPKRPLKTILGETFEYLIPPKDKVKVFRELYPFDNLPTSWMTMRDVHTGAKFQVKEYKVIEQNGYVMPVSPYFAEDGASVVDWEPVEEENENFFESKVMDRELAATFSAGYSDGFYGRDDGVRKPARKTGMKVSRYREIEEAYEEGYGMGYMDRRKKKAQNETPVEPSPAPRKKRRLMKR